MNYASIVRRHKPRGWHLKFRPAGTKLWAMADFGLKTIFTVPVVDRDTLQIYLHEVGHVRYRHYPVATPAHVEEYEAERYSFAAMRHEGVPVPRKSLYRAKSNVRRRIKEDVKRGVRIDPKVKRWSFK
jgi:hypothetical protein